MNKGRADSRERLAAAMAKLEKSDAGTSSLYLCSLLHVVSPPFTFPFPIRLLSNYLQPDETHSYSGSLSHKHSQPEKKTEMWRSQLVACGSNAFGQSYFQDIMSSSFKALKFESNEQIVEIECGSTLTAARLQSGTHNSNL